jgi:hypothetical protein
MILQKSGQSHTGQMAFTVIHFGARVTARLLDKEMAAALLALSVGILH